MSAPNLARLDILVDRIDQSTTSLAADTRAWMFSSDSYGQSRYEQWVRELHQSTPVDGVDFVAQIEGASPPVDIHGHLEGVEATGIYLDDL
jgi:hypothetical protein